MHVESPSQGVRCVQPNRTRDMFICEYCDFSGFKGYGHSMRVEPSFHGERFEGNTAPTLARGQRQDMRLSRVPHPPTGKQVRVCKRCSLVFDSSGQLRDPMAQVDKYASNFHDRHVAAFQSCAPSRSASVPLHAPSHCAPVSSPAPVAPPPFSRRPSIVVLSCPPTTAVNLRPSDFAWKVAAAAVQRLLRCT